MLVRLRRPLDAFISRTEKPLRFDTATGMARDADFSRGRPLDKRPSSPPSRAPSINPLAELARIVEKAPMSPDQCRAARERVLWTQRKLAAAADAPLSVIVAYESGRPVPDRKLLDRVRAVLEEVGVGFPFALSRGKAKPAGIVYSPRSKGEMH